MKVVIMQGVPGSGKSHYANALGGVVVSADNYFMVGGEYRFDPSKIGQAHGACFRSFIEALQAGAELVVVDNTNTTVSEVSPYVLGAQAFGYEVEIIRIDCDPKVAAARNSHGVPEAAVLAMHDRLQACQLMPWWKLTVLPAWTP